MRIDGELARTPVFDRFQAANQDWINRAQAIHGQFPLVAPQPRYLANGRPNIHYMNPRRGYHKFQNLGKLEDFSMQPLKMRDFNCTYESLMVILYLHEVGQLPAKLGANWFHYVLTHFNTESFEDQQIILEGCVYEILLFFFRKYRIDVGYFNVHHCRDEVGKVLGYERYYEEFKMINPNLIAPQKYFLAYYLHHVFPVERK